MIRMTRPLPVLSLALVSCGPGEPRMDVRPAADVSLPVGGWRGAMPSGLEMRLTMDGRGGYRMDAGPRGGVDIVLSTASGRMRAVADGYEGTTDAAVKGALASCSPWRASMAHGELELSAGCGRTVLRPSR